MTNHHVRLSHSREATKKKKKKRVFQGESVLLRTDKHHSNFYNIKHYPTRCPCRVIKHVAGHRLHTNFLW